MTAISPIALIVVLALHFRFPNRCIALRRNCCNVTNMLSPDMNLASLDDVVLAIVICFLKVERHSVEGSRARKSSTLAVPVTVSLSVDTNGSIRNHGTRPPIRERQRGRNCKDADSRRECDFDPNRAGQCPPVLATDGCHPTAPFIRALFDPP
jgi:hypothetical protein